MKNLKMKYTGIAAVCLLLLALLPTSCIKDDYAAKEKATVQVTFTTRAEANTTVAGSNLAENERMKTLRVIVAKGNDILYNVYYDTFDTDKETGALFKTITFSELTVSTEGEEFDFYAIANEKGIKSPSVVWDNLTSEILKTWGSGGPTVTEIDPTLIPQTAFKTIKVTPDDSDNVSMQLEFVVAKVKAQVTNNTGNPALVEYVVLAGAEASGISLFPVMEGTGAAKPYNDLTMDNFNVPAGGSSEKTFYVFPGTLSTLTGTWGTDQMTDIPEDVKNLYKRGTLLNVNIKLSSVEEQVTVDLDWKVADWFSETVGVPSFD